MKMIHYGIAELTHRSGRTSRVSAHPSEGPFWYGKYLSDDVVGVKLIRDGSVELIGTRL